MRRNHMAPRETDVKTWHNINPRRFFPPLYNTNHLGNHSLNRNRSTSCSRICSPYRSRWWRLMTSYVTSPHCSPLQSSCFHLEGFFGQFPTMVLLHLLFHCQDWLTFSFYRSRVCGYFFFYYISFFVLC